MIVPLMQTYYNVKYQPKDIRFSWCSLLSRQSNTLKVSGSSPGENSFLFFLLSSVALCSVLCARTCEPGTEHLQPPGHMDLFVSLHMRAGPGCWGADAHVFLGKIHLSSKFQ